MKLTKQSVKTENIAPMIHYTEEMDALVSQNVIPSKKVFGGAMPMAFTEQGVAMLSSSTRSWGLDKVADKLADFEKLPNEVEKS